MKNTYKFYDREASSIITKLQNRIAKKGYCENLGQNELRKFKDRLSNSELTYPEKAQIVEMLSSTINQL